MCTGSNTVSYPKWLVEVVKCPTSQVLPTLVLLSSVLGGAVGTFYSLELSFCKRSQRRTEKWSGRVEGAVDSRWERIWVLGHAVLPSNCLSVNFLVLGFLSYAVKGFDWILFKLPCCSPTSWYNLLNIVPADFLRCSLMSFIQRTAAVACEMHWERFNPWILRASYLPATTSVLS